MSHAENGVRRGIVSIRGQGAGGGGQVVVVVSGSSFAAYERMRNTVLILMLVTALGCMKKQADGTYKVDKKQVNTNTEKLKAEAKRVEKKAGEGLQKAGEKLKRDAAKH